MIPLKLSVRGFYSYTREQVIDFEQLTAARIFGIFGPTGSGKSSIPEAISFALYGDTDRLNQKESRGYNMMNLKSDELFIEFIFRAGQPLQKYRSTVSARRNSKTFNDVKSIERKAYAWENGSWKPVEPTEIEKVIGLSYSNFKRTTIIPQGKFQEFLQLGDADRIRMMKELFGLEKFDLQYKTAALLKKTNDKKIDTEARLSELQGVDENMLKEIETRIQEKSVLLSALSIALENMQTNVKELLRRKELFQLYTIQKQQLDDILLKTEEMNHLEIKTSRYQYCLTHFKALFSKTDELKLQVTKVKSELDAQKLNELSVTNVLQESERQFKGIEKDHAELPAVNEKIRQLKLLVDFTEIDNEIRKYQISLEKGQSFLNETERELLQITDARKVLQDDLLQIQANMTDASFLEQLGQWWQKNEFFLNALKDVGRIVEEHTRDIKASLDTFHHHKGIQNYPEYAPDAEPSAFVNILDIKTEQLTARFKLMEEELQSLQVRGKLAEFATHLTDGAPCPLCGSTEHPRVYDDPGTHERILVLKAEIQRIYTDIKHIAGLIDFCKRIHHEIEFLTKLNQTAVTKQQAALQAFNNHTGSFIFNPFSSNDKSGYQKANENLKLLKTQEEKIRIQLDANDKNFKEKLELKNKAAGKLLKLTGELGNFRGRAEELKTQISSELLDEFKAGSIEEPEKEAKDLEELAERIKTDFERLNRQIAEGRQNLANIQGQISAKQNQLNELEKELLKTLTDTDQAVTASEFQDANVAKSILSENFDPTKASEALNRWKTHRDTLHTAVQKLANQVIESPYDSAKHELLTSEIQTTDQQKSLATGELAVLNQQLVEGRIKLLKWNELTREFSKTERRADRLEIMKNLFQASGFVNFVSSVYMQSLVNAANERFFKLTGQKLRLELTARNDFEVRDFMNNGQTRHVKTLSGGQTFQASLSLALALADSIHYQKHSEENFFFLDEGFGSLDRESLQMVFDTLKALRSENRIVGIISHVEELQQEIDAHIRITNTPESGSLVVSSFSAQP